MNQPGSDRDLNDKIQREEDDKIQREEDDKIQREAIRKYLEGDSSDFQLRVNHAKKTLKKLSDEAVKRFVDRKEAVRFILAALASGVPSVLLGPPGTAKSALVRKISSLCGLGLDPDNEDYFEYLITTHTMPEEIFGAPNFQILTEKHRIERNTKHKLPNAKIAFLDEIFRGNSQILNTLLTIVNERLFHDGNEVKPVKLIGIVGAANEPPIGEDLTAFYDRFPLRSWVYSIYQDSDGAKEEGDRTEQLLAKSLDIEMATLTRSPKIAKQVKPIFDVNDFTTLRAGIHKELLGFPTDRKFGDFVEYWSDFRELCGLSDRTLLPLARFAIAWEWLNPRENGFLEVFRFTAPDENTAKTARNRVEDHKSKNSVESDT